MTIEDFDWLVETANIIGNITLKAEQINWLIEQINKLTKERDAAIEDLKNEAFCRCFVCKHHVLGMCVSDGVTDGDCWEWRGLENE